MRTNNIQIPRAQLDFLSIVHLRFIETLLSGQACVADYTGSGKCAAERRKRETDVCSVSNKSGCGSLHRKKNVWPYSLWVNGRFQHLLRMLKLLY